MKRGVAGDAVGSLSFWRKNDVRWVRYGRLSDFYCNKPVAWHVHNSARGWGLGYETRVWQLRWQEYRTNHAVTDPSGNRPFPLRC